MAVQKHKKIRGNGTRTNKNIRAIIPAAGAATNHILPNNNLPDTMLPINGKPVIGHILDDLLARRIPSATIVLRFDDSQTEAYVMRMYSSRLNLSIIRNTKPERGVGYSIALASKNAEEDESFLVYLGDTLYKGPLSFKKDFIVVTQLTGESSKWCLVEKQKNNLLFINKPHTYDGSGKILCGIYFLKDGRNARKILSSLHATLKKIEMADLLNKYAQLHTPTLVPAKQWYDCGNLENYYKAKIDFLRVRSFNTITHNDTYGHITKHSKNKKKIADEIYWYKNIPPDVAIFAPRIFSHSTKGKHASYSTEFYGYQSLADMFLFESLSVPAWHTVIKKIFSTLSLFRKHQRYVPFTHYHTMYYEKTHTRLRELTGHKKWNSLINKPTLHINGIPHHNIHYFLPKIKKSLKKLHHPKEMSFIHGDFCLGNILYDPLGNILKCIDPRGNFGKTSIYGDQKYDVAKLRHSFNGYYDFIVSDLFTLTETKNGWELQFFTNSNTQKIGAYFDEELKKNGFDINSIKLIEALLFISMTPLHKDAPKRQKAMYLRGIMLLNQIYTT